MRDIVRVVIELDREVVFHDEHLDDPSRVFVDLPATQAAAPLKDQTLRFDGDGDLVHQVRIGRHPGSTTRVVLDTEGVSSYSIYPLYSPYRLVIDCLRPATEPAAEMGPAPRLPSKAAPLLLSDSAPDRRLDRDASGARAVAATAAARRGSRGDRRRSPRAARAPARVARRNHVGDAAAADGASRRAIWTADFRSPRSSG